MPRVKLLTSNVYSPTNPSSEAAIRGQIDGSIAEVYDAFTAATGSAIVGHDSPNIVADNVNEALEELKTDLQGITQGGIADGSITNVKLSNAPGDILSTVTQLTPIVGTSTIPTTGWVANTGDNTLKYNLAITEVLSTSWVDITIDKDYQDTALDAEINPTITEYNGGVTIYANVAPAVAIPIRYKVVL